MGDNDFPVLMGNGGNSVGFAKNFAASMRGGKINNTWLPSTGDFFSEQQSMQDGQVSPVEGVYGEFVNTPENADSTGSQQSYGFAFPTPFSSNGGDIAEAPRYIHVPPDIDSPAFERWMQSRPGYGAPGTAPQDFLRNKPSMQQKYRGVGGFSA